MFSKGIVTMAAVGCFCLPAAAEDANQALRRCSQVCKRMATGADVTLERDASGWHITGIVLLEGPGDSDLDQLASLSELEDVQLARYTSGARDRVTAKGFAKLAPLRRLRRLVVDVDVSSAAMKAISELRSLEELDISYCNGVTVEGIEHLMGLPNLRRLDMSFVGVKDAWLAPVAAMTQLTDLNLKEAGITDRGLKRLTGLTNLVSLNLASTDVSGRGVEVLSVLPRLGKLAFGATGEWVLDGNTDLSGLKTLEDLTIETCISGNWDRLRFPPGLRSVSLPPELMEAYVRQGSLTRVRHINVNSGAGENRSMSMVTMLKAMPELAEYDSMDPDPASLAEVKSLRELRYWQRRKLDANTSGGFGKLGQLRALRMAIQDARAAINGEGLGPIWELVQLSELELGGLMRIEPKQLAGIDALRDLEKLSLGFGYGAERTMPIDGMLAQIRTLHKLRELSLGGAKVKVTDEGLGHLQSLRKLRRLDMTYWGGCEGYTDGGLVSLVAALPELQVLRLRFARPPEKPDGGK